MNIMNEIKQLVKFTIDQMDYYDKQYEKGKANNMSKEEVREFNSIVISEGRLREENKRLKDEIAKLKSKIKEQDEYIKDLEDTILTMQDVINNKV